MNIPDGSLCVSVSLASAMRDNSPKEYLASAVMDLLRTAAKNEAPLKDILVVIALVDPTKETHRV